MSAFSGKDNKGSDEEQSLYDRFKKLTGRAPVVLEATAPPKSDDELKKGEEDLAKQFQSIFGAKPFAYSDARHPANNGSIDLAKSHESTNVKQKDEELAKRFESIFGERPVAYGERGSCRDKALGKQAANEMVSDNWVAETVNNLPYDGNDDEIDLLFAETEDANEGDDLIASVASLGKVGLNCVKGTDGEDGVVVAGFVSDEAEELIKQTKQNVILEQHMNCTDVDRSRSTLFETTFGIADNDTLDDEVLEVIRKAKEEAILDKKFGLMIKEEDGNCSDGNNKGKSGSSTKSDSDSSYDSSSDDSEY